MNKKVDLPTGIHVIPSDLLEVVHDFDSDELIWFSGYCAGLAKGLDETKSSSKQLSKQMAKQSELTVSLKVLIVYASQTGNAQKIAEALYQKINQDSGRKILSKSGQNNLQLELASLNDFNAKDLKNQNIILLVTSTHGEGEPPDDAIDFLEQIKSKRAVKLNDSQHAVLSLGDSSYQYFCQTGKDFDLAFSQIGSKPLMDRVDCDLDYEEVSNQWIEQINDRLSALVNIKSASVSTIKDSFAKDSIEIEAIENQYSKQNPFVATVLSNQKITGRDSTKQVHHIELSIEDSRLQYEPGDSIGIWPNNNLQLIEELLQLTKLSGEQSVILKGAEICLRKALQQRLEITLINKNFVDSFTALIAQSDTEQAQQVKVIINQDYAGYIKHHQIIDILALAPVQWQAQKLVELLNPIKPRMYSISSSLDANPEEVHITVALKKSTDNDIIRYGAASQFLIETLKEESSVSIFIEENKRFKLPKDDLPIIMIGPGTGIAPFRAFLQQRQVQSATGENWLVFGNANFNTDFLYQLELQKYQSKGLLNKLDVAFSRDQEDKIYVQHRLEENAKELWDWLDSKQAYFYVCGDMNSMAKDVDKSLIKIISEQGEKSISQAKQYLKSLKKENRYQRDVY